MVSERIIGHGEKILCAFLHRKQSVFIVLVENVDSAGRIDATAAIDWPKI